MARSISGTLAAVMAAAAREPVSVLHIDWDGDGASVYGNRIPDGDFETTGSDTAWGYVPGASYTPPVSAVRAISGQTVGSITAPAPHAGTYSLAVTWSNAVTGTGTMCGRDVQLTVGQAYQVSAWVYVPASSPAVKLRVQQIGNPPVTTDSASSSGTGSWQQLTIASYTAVVPRVLIGVFEPSSTASTVYVFVDDVQVTPLAPILDIDSIPVESVEIDESLVTDLPDTVQLITGYSSKELRASVAAGTDPTGLAVRAQYSPYNPASPMFGKQEISQAVTVDLGARTSAGVETVRVYTGQVRDMDTDAAGDTVNLTALDGAERLRGAATLPVILADDGLDAGVAYRFGLNTQWVIDYLLRQGGYYLSPPARALCRWSQTMHGSAFPEVGQATSTYVSHYSPDGTIEMSRNQCQFVSGRFGLALDPQVSPVDGVFWSGKLSGTLSLNNNGTLLLEAWAYGRAPVGGGQATFALLASDDASATLKWWVNSSGVLKCDTLRLGVSKSLTGPSFPTDGAWHYIGLFVTFSSTTITATFRVDGTSTVASTAASSVTTAKPITEVNGQPHTYVEAFQVSADASAVWNDTFTSTVTLDAGTLELTVTPQLSDNTALADVLNDIVAAEQGTLVFDDNNHPLFRNASYWQRNGTVAATITSQDALKRATISRAVDQVRNRVTIGVTAPTVTARADVWRADVVYYIPPNNTVVITADINKTVANMGNQLVDGGNAYSPASWSRFSANTNADGTGTDVTGVLSASLVTLGTTAKITFVNPGGTGLWLVASGGFSDALGTPSLVLTGSEIDYGNTNDQTVDIADPASIAQPWGEQALKIDGNAWIQDFTSARDLAIQLLSWLRWPRPMLTNVDVVGDLARQLGDRTTLADPGGTILGEDWFVVGIRTGMSTSEGFTQSLDLRGCTLPGQIVLGRIGRCELGSIRL